MWPMGIEISEGGQVNSYLFVARFQQVSYDSDYFIHLLIMFSE